MGPFNLNRQYKRKEAVQRLLSRADLPTETRDMWQRIHSEITLDEAVYNKRVCETYANHKVQGVDYE